FTLNVNIAPPPTTGNGIPPDLRRQSYYAATGTVKLQYFFTDDWMGYVSFDRAHRPGSPNLNVSGSLPTDFAVLPEETANSVEFGIKGGFWDGRGRISAALYDQVYKHFQVDTGNFTVWSPATGALATQSNIQVAAQEAE